MATVRPGPLQFQGLFQEVFAGKFTIDMSADIADGAGTTFAVVVPGAQVGDFVLASWVADNQDATITAYVSVSATNTVEIRVQNESGAAITTPTATETWRVVVLRPNLAFFT